MPTAFRHVTKYTDTRISDNLGFGIVQFLNQCYLNVGAFSNIEVPTTGTYGGNLHQLRAVRDPRYTNGTVWEAFRSNWVFESDTVASEAPIVASGVYVNGVFNPTTGVANAHYINYPYGQVVFSGALPLNTSVTCNYAFKYVNITTNDVPWAREFMKDSLRPDLGGFNQFASGAWNTLAQNRVQLPAIIVHPLTSVRLEGTELGGMNKRYQDVLFHVYAEHPYDKTSIADDLINQKDAWFTLYNRDTVLASGFYPLDHRGAKSSNGRGYESLINDLPYVYRKCVITDSTSKDYGKINGLWYSTVRWTVEIWL